MFALIFVPLAPYVNGTSPSLRTSAGTHAIQSLIKAQADAVMKIRRSIKTYQFRKTAKLIPEAKNAIRLKSSLEAEKKKVAAQEKLKEVQKQQALEEGLLAKAREIENAKRKKEEDLRKDLNNPIKMEAARKIQRQWSRCKKTPDYNGKIGTWLKQYRQDFVAHAIFQVENVSKILQAGAVKPAEQLFREEGEVEFEKGSTYGSRGKSVWSPKNREKFEEIAKKYPYTNGGLRVETQVLNKDKFLEWQDVSIGETVDISHPSTNNYRLSMSHKTWYYFLDMYKELKIQFPNEAKNFYEYHFQIIKDHYTAPKQKIDYILSLYHEKLIQQGEPRMKAWEKCSVLRDSLILPNKLNPEVRTGKKCIYWSYGQVVVMRGNGASVTGSVFGSEAALLAPYQNKGQFFSLDLAREDTVILGPKNILASEIQKYPNYKFVFIEELTPRQRIFLKVPLRFRPKNTQGT